MDHIRDYYHVPAAVGGRVEYTGRGRPIGGVITGAAGPYLMIRLDGDAYAAPFHPTWELTYKDVQ